MQKHVTDIQVGIVDGAIGWVFIYTTGETESFLFNIETTRQFAMALQEVVLQHDHLPCKETLGVGESVALRLKPHEDAP